MKPKRWISAVVLVTLVAVQALPAHAGRMLCPMKESSRAEACSRCDGAEPPSAGRVLQARGCCRITPAEAVNSTPFVLTSPRRGAAMDDHSIHFALLPAMTTTLEGRSTRAPALGPLPLPPSLTSPSRTTVLRI